MIRRVLGWLDSWQVFNFMFIAFGAFMLFSLDGTDGYAMFMRVYWGIIMAVYGWLIANRSRVKSDRQWLDLLDSTERVLRRTTDLVTIYSKGPAAKPTDDRTTKMLALAAWLDSMDDVLSSQQRDVQADLRQWAVQEATE